jgi:multiubiquitin
MSEEPQKPHETVIHIDRQEYRVTATGMTGAQLKTLAGKDASYQLFLEEQGNDPDRLISDTQSIALTNGMHFYTVPPATLGH